MGWVMRGAMPAWAEFGVLRVIDGDDILLRDELGQETRYRLAGYDAPETHNFRSRHDRLLEEVRGIKAMFRLATLIRNARQVHLLDSTRELDRHKRRSGILLIDGWEAGRIALDQRWAVPHQLRQRTDWGDLRTPFADDDLPLPNEFAGMEAALLTPPEDHVIASRRRR